MVPEVPGYEILGEVGRGGMGVVYRARQTSLGREVALKVVRPEAGLDEEFLARFEREAQAAALTHPSIVPVYEYGDAQGMPYLVMAYLSGGTLRDRLDRDGRLPQSEIAAVGASLAGALAHSHAQGVVHRDVKPSNVLFDEDGHAYLGDFGIARLVDSTKLTKTSVTVGTTDYLAPELAVGGAATPASDVYALGATLFECVVGSPPFVADDALAVLFKHRFEPVPTLPEGLNAELRKIIETSLA
ncbi:MAG: serine/threonine-protein kinase, partial [Microthrixaceae bacterium]